MPPVRMYIDKFKREVLIEDDHPLVREQVAKNAAAVVPDRAPDTSPPAANPMPTTPALAERGSDKAVRESGDARGQSRPKSSRSRQPAKIEHLLVDEDLKDVPLGDDEEI